MKKTYTALLTAILVIGLGLSIEHFGTVLADSSTPQPSVPEFTVQVIDYRYDVPATTSTDPYTGEIVIHPGYRAGSVSIDLSIQNQIINSSYQLHYNVRTKGHFENEWRELYSETEFNSESQVSCPLQSESQYTVLSYYACYPANAQIDYQVKAILGHLEINSLADHSFPAYWTEFVIDGTSDWSSTKTVTNNITAPTTTPNTPPPSENPKTSLDQEQKSTPSSTDQSASQTSASSSLDWVHIATLTLLSAINVLLAIIAVAYLRRRTPKRPQNLT